MGINFYSAKKEEFIVRNLSPGDCFIYNNQYYMAIKIDSADSLSEDQPAVCLLSGMVIVLDPETKVKPISIKADIKLEGG